MDFVLAAKPHETLVGSIQLLLKGSWPEVQKIHQKHPQSGACSCTPAPARRLGESMLARLIFNLLQGITATKKKLTSTQNNTDQQVKDQPGKLVVKLKFLRFLFGYPATGGQSADEFHIDLNRTPKPYWESLADSRYAIDFWCIVIIFYQNFHPGTEGTSFRPPPLTVKRMPRFKACIVHQRMHPGWNP